MTIFVFTKKVSNLSIRRESPGPIRPISLFCDSNILGIGISSIGNFIHHSTFYNLWVNIWVYSVKLGKMRFLCFKLSLGLIIYYMFI